MNNQQVDLLRCDCLGSASAHECKQQERRSEMKGHKSASTAARAPCFDGGARWSRRFVGKLFVEVGDGKPKFDLFLLPLSGGAAVKKDTGVVFVVAYE